MHASLSPARFIDSDHPLVIDFTERWRGASRDPREQAVNLYRAVRDEIRYNPYVFNRDAETLKASHALQAGESYCVPKATLLAACARHCGIPARIGLADVRNHLASPRILELMGSDVFRWHAYTLLFLDDRWVKATPAFDLAFCARFDVEPLDFDGSTDSIFQPFDAAGRQHMDYVLDRGDHDEMPYEAFREAMQAAYPRLITAMAAERAALAGKAHAKPASQA